MTRFSGMLWSLTAAAAAISGICSTNICQADDSINSFLATAPVVKTPEYLAQGERNVRSVAQQLKQLLEPIPASGKKMITPLPKPDFTIIPGSNGRSTLIYRCRYIKANRASVVAIENMLRNGSVEYHEEQNLLTIHDSSENIENLKNLDLCGDELFTFVCLPIKIENSDGAPARAIAIIEE